MPHSLTERQKECLQFIRQYIVENESSPRLEEISGYLGIKPPTAHKLLRALQSKGYLYFGRDSISGFFIRLIDRAGSLESVMEIPLMGKIDHYGEVFDFPQKLGHFASVFMGSKPDEVFALGVTEDIPVENIVSQDFIIFDMGKEPQPGDICIAPMGERLFLVKIYSKTFDRDTPDMLNSIQYPIPEKLTNLEYGQRLNWVPLAYDENTKDFYLDVSEEQKWPVKPLDPEMVLATALRLVRALAF